MPAVKKNIIKQAVSNFKAISLEEMDKVALMNRVDRKFILPFRDLLEFIPLLQDDYHILTIKEEKVFTYKTDYYDTPGLNMFIDHHNGKLNRFKIRHREYVESNLEFLEIKFKNNKGKTLKKRVESNHIGSKSAHQLITEYTPYNPSVLDRKITTLFNRFTLVDNQLTSRITTDFNLKFDGSRSNHPARQPGHHRNQAGKTKRQQQHFQPAERKIHQALLFQQVLHGAYHDEQPAQVQYF